MKNKIQKMTVLTLGLFLALPFSSIRAAGEEDLLQRISALEKKVKRVDELENEVTALKKQLELTPTGEGGDRGTDYIPRKAGKFSDEKLSPSFGGVYTKPFLKRYGRNTYVGGYMDMEYIDDQDSNARFRQHRLIPFIYSDVSDRVKLATEIEFEDGGPQNNRADGEVKIEFATMDYLLNEKVNFRTGILLSPLGKLNLVHDSPIQDLVNRPLVDTNIIPTTLSEAGAGFYGTFYPSELSKLDYEIYLVNGFEGIASNGTARFSPSSGLRGGRGSEKTDVNDDPAMVGRLAYSPFLGLETGFSTHVGDYDATGKNLLAIYAWDTTFQKGPFELLFEAAYADIHRNAFAESKGIPGNLWGYYVQGNYHFLPGFLKKGLPAFFTDESKFTLSVRWDQMDLDGSESSRFTAGLNFRPTEDTVFKLAHEWNLESGSLADTGNNELQLSAATYF